MHFPWIDVGDVRHLYSINEGKASKRFSTVQTFSLPLGILTQLNFTARLAVAQQRKMPRACPVTSRTGFAQKVGT